MDDTWGISGPEFLRGYVALTVIGLIVALLARLRLRSAASTTTRPLDSFTPAEVGFLLGGAPRAVLAAVGQLRAAGALSASAGRLRVTAKRPHQQLDPAAQAVLDAAAGRCSPKSLHRHPAVTAALGRVERELARDGLAAHPVRRAAARLTGLLILTIAGFGVVRLASIANHRSFWWQWLAVATLVSMIAGIAALVVPRRTREGNRLLARLEQRHRHLAPTKRPSWAAYGPAAAGLGVAIFGVQSVWAADPGFAAAAKLAPYRSGDGAGSGSAGGCGGGGGGGCSGGGGGGCGGGCGG
jgi:uncharacterized protein (TIGR04222 family)